MSRFVPVLGGLLLLSLTSSSPGQTQRELNEEAKRAFDKADAALNEAYGKVLATLDEAGREKLREAQRAWVKFRDAECDSQADQYRGGTMRPLVYCRCAARLTAERTAQLRDRLGP